MAEIIFPTREDIQKISHLIRTDYGMIYGMTYCMKHFFRRGYAGQIGKLGDSNSGLFLDNILIEVTWRPCDYENAPISLDQVHKDEFEKKFNFFGELEKIAVCKGIEIKHVNSLDCDGFPQNNYVFSRKNN